MEVQNELAHLGDQSHREPVLKQCLLIVFIFNHEVCEGLCYPSFIEKDLHFRFGKDIKNNYYKFWWQFDTQLASNAYVLEKLLRKKKKKVKQVLFIDSRVERIPNELMTY